MPYSGFDGYVMLNDGSSSKVIGYMNRWTVSVSQDTIDVSSFDPALGPVAKRFRKFLPGPLGWTATFDGFVVPEDDGQKALRTAIENATTLTFYFFLNSDKYLVGNGIITTEDFELGWDAAGTVSFDVTGTQMLTKIGWD